MSYKYRYKLYCNFTYGEQHDTETTTIFSSKKIKPKTVKAMIQQMKIERGMLFKGTVTYRLVLEKEVKIK